MHLGSIYRKSLGTDLFGTLSTSISLLYASLMWQGLIGPDSFLSIITILAVNHIKEHVWGRVFQISVYKLFSSLVMHNTMQFLKVGNIIVFATSQSSCILYYGHRNTAVTSSLLPFKSNMCFYSANEIFLKIMISRNICTPVSTSSPTNIFAIPQTTIVIGKEIFWDPVMLTNNCFHNMREK